VKVPLLVVFCANAETGMSERIAATVRADHIVESTAYESHEY
jgi:hypothetical protein